MRWNKNQYDIQKNTISLSNKYDNLDWYEGETLI